MKEERPLRFFGILSGIFLLIATGLAIPLIWTYMEIGLVPRLPTAVLVSALSIISLLLLMSGVILETVTRGRRENKRMNYLAILAANIGHRPSRTVISHNGLHPVSKTPS